MRNSLLFVVRKAIYWIVVWPFVMIYFGIWVRGRTKLPSKGPYCLVLNHNSHLDTFVAFAIMPNTLRSKLRPIAAMDYFFDKKIKAWFAKYILRAIGLDRGGSGLRAVLRQVQEAVDHGEVPMIFPEGTRGEPGVAAQFQPGIALIAKQHPDLQFFPVYLSGTERALPKGEWLPLPVRVDVFVGDPLCYTGDKGSFMASLEDRFAHLRSMKSGEAYVAAPTNEVLQTV